MIVVDTNILAYHCLPGPANAKTKRLLQLEPEWGARSRGTAYDCAFAALAEALGTVLVTADKALLAAFPKLCRSLDQVR